MQLYVHFCLHMYVPAVPKDTHTHTQRETTHTVLVLFLHTYMFRLPIYVSFPLKL